MKLVQQSALFDHHYYQICTLGEIVFELHAFRIRNYIYLLITI
jgi:hypothetical protein